MDLLGNAEEPVEAEYRGLFWSHAQDVTDLVREFSITATDNGKCHSSSGSLITPSGNEEPQVDADGNLTRDHLWNYVWNSENRLVQQTHRSDIRLAPLQSKRMSYLYDSQGRRFKRITSSLDAVTGTYVPEEIRYFVYDGRNLLAGINCFKLKLRNDDST